MNVWYLHGLESEAGGPKVDFLFGVADKVFAPYINYNFHGMFEGLLKLAKYNKPDLIIGSSMGGYFADALGSHLDTEVLLFNPALHSRSMEPEGVTYGKSNWERNFVVGTKDRVIDPKATLVYKDIAKSYTEIEGMGHRTSLNVFTDIYNKWSTNQL
tara:strand:+ start:370 stop:840 length:471 start_codon:yes stop_codon:yes gene_type:complete